MTNTDNVTLIDPLDYEFGLLDRMYKEYEGKQAPQHMERLAGMIRSADGFVVTSGEYNHSIPPALTNLIDHFLEEYFFRPSGIVCYSKGMFGGVRAAMQLRALLAEIGTVSIPTIFAIPNVQDTFDEEGNPHNEKYHEYIEQFLLELEWYSRVMKEGRKKHEVPY